nr:triple gene block 2 [Hydrangea chlorotic mottle virus]
MPLTPPPNFTQTYLAAAVGISTAILVGLLTRSTLPHAGDLQHSLPHGGRYRDGTKSVDYCSPRKLNSVERGFQGQWLIWPLVIVLVGLVIFLSKNRSNCYACGATH